MALSLAPHADSMPDAVALADGDRELSWPEVNSAVNRATNAMLAMNLGDALRVSVFARNSTEVVLAHYAALCAGVSSVPTSSLLGADELAYVLTDSGAKAVFAGPETMTLPCRLRVLPEYQG